VHILLADVLNNLMADHNINIITDNEIRLDFIKHLLSDIKALEYLVEKGLIESNIQRIGAEQEFCLVTDNWRPSKMGAEILEILEDNHFTSELARYNLEINLDPFELQGKCFSLVENQLKTLLAKAKKAAATYDNKVVLTGILPTISKIELEFDYMTPNPRYRAMNNMMKEHKGSDFELRLRGVDELSIIHDSVLFEACNTSFQMHLQIAPEDFISSYNWAQTISGPVLGVCANSPLLLGRELWSETRIALFQQSIDTRNSSYALKDQKARVSFGDHWAAGSVAEIFKSDISQHKILLAQEIESNSMEELQRGEMPKLQALCLNNSTIYRWNRPCYGVANGKAHLRIENRYIPSGPTLIDEMANFAFWVGLMVGRPAKFDNMESIMDFRDAKANFVKAARTGKESVINWMGRLISVRDLILDELLPIARLGLEKEAIDQDDIDRLLGIIEQRAKGFTGAQWKVRRYRQLRKTMKQDDALLALTKTIYENQQCDNPVSLWPLIENQPETHEAAHQVGHIMSTQLFTVNENDLAELATSVMKWKKIRHVPVEDDGGNLCGLLTRTHIKREGANINDIVTNIMTKDVRTVQPETEISEAIKIMKKNEFGCLPVVSKNHLVGIITINDVIPFDHD
jgi:CBS domain-containing protein